MKFVVYAVVKNFGLIVEAVCCVETLVSTCKYTLYFYPEDQHRHIVFFWKILPEDFLTNFICSVLDF